jgi:hypothetical protein
VDVDDPEHPVQHVLHRVDVLHARVRDVPLVPEDEARSNHQLALFVAIPEGGVPNHDRRAVRDEEQERPRLPITARGSGGDEHHESGNEELAQFLAQPEEQRVWMQTPVRRHPIPPAGADDRESRAPFRARDRARRRSHPPCLRCE